MRLVEWGAGLRRGSLVVLAAASVSVMLPPAAHGAGFVVQNQLSPTGEKVESGGFAINASGESIVSWVKENFSGAEVVDAAIHRTSNVWSSGNVFTPTGSNNVSSLAPVGIDNAGNAYSFWTQGSATSAALNLATHPPGGSWGAPVAVSSGEGASNIQAAVNGEGAIAVLAVLNHNNPAEVYGWTRPAGSSTFTRSADLVADNGVPPYEIAINEAGDAVGLVGVYDSNSMRQAGPVYFTAGAGGGWHLESVLHPTNSTAIENSAVAIDEAGDAIAMFIQAEDGGSGKYPRVWWAKRTPGKSGTWTTAAALTPNEASSSAADGQVSVAMNAAGEAVAAWTIDSETTPKLQVATLPAGSSTWTTPATLSATDPSGPSVAIDRAGDAMVVFGASESPNSVVRAVVRPAGDSSFGASVLVSPATGTYFNPHVAFDAAGDALVSYNGREGSEGATQRASGYDLGPKVGTVSFPATGATGVSLPFSVSPADVWSPISKIEWSFGDGTTATGSSGVKTYSAAGEYTVAVTATDEAGLTGTAKVGTTIAQGAGTATKGATGSTGATGVTGSTGGGSTAGTSMVTASPVVQLPGSVKIDPKTGIGSAVVKCQASAGDECVVSGILREAGAGGAAAAKKGGKGKGKGKGKPAKLGSFGGTIQGGQSGKITFTFSKKGLALLKRKRSLRAQAIGKSHNRAGTSVAIEATVAFKLKKR